MNASVWGTPLIVLAASIAAGTSSSTPHRAPSEADNCASGGILPPSTG